MLVSPGSFNLLTKLDLRRMHNTRTLNIEIPLSQLLLNPFNLIEIETTFNSGLDNREVGLRVCAQ